MKIGIIADLHSNQENWQKINQLLGWQGVKELIIAGDITDAQMLDHIAQDFSGLIHVVFGNMDQQINVMQLLADRYSHLRIYGFNGKFIIAKKKFIASHYEQEAKDLLAEKENAILVCGHTHEKKEEKTNHYLLINPGTAGGIFKKASFAVYDLSIEKLTFIDL